MSSFKPLTPSQMEAREKRFPVGARVELISMDDPYNKTLTEGSKGTITRVDPFGDLEVDWDNGSTLKLIVGEDQFKVI